MNRHQLEKWLFVFFLFSVLLPSSCIDNEALRGRITLALTDAPADNTSIKKVNIAIRQIGILPENSQNWVVLKSFEEPRVINLLEYTQGEVFDLTEQYLGSSEYKSIRLELNVALEDNGLTVFPENSIEFTNGNSETLFIEGQDNYAQTDAAFEVNAGEITFLTIDFDLRKSLIETPDGYRLKPFIRLVNTRGCGAIEGYFRNSSVKPRVAVYAYKAGTYAATEATTDIPFFNAETSDRVKTNETGKFITSFLPEGKYDLIFVELNSNGTVKEVLGKLESIDVNALETNQIQSVFLDDLVPIN
ncbi:MAG: DUF4382 domain-containing protein [Chryseotalea sp.]|jgi:hypothetical protein